MPRLPVRGSPPADNKEREISFWCRHEAIMKLFNVMKTEVQLEKILENWRVNGLKCFQKRKTLRARQQLSMEGCKVHASLLLNSQLQFCFGSGP